MTYNPSQYVFYWEIPLKHMKKVIVGLITVLFLALPGMVQASSEECTTTTGSYGQTSTTCKVLGTTTVTHSTVGAGIGDMNFLMLAGILVVAAGLMFGVSKLTQKVYWFD